MNCPKCRYASGDDWEQCEGSCPMLMSPYYDAGCRHAFGEPVIEHDAQLQRPIDVRHGGWWLDPGAGSSLFSGLSNGPAKPVHECSVDELLANLKEIEALVPKNPPSWNPSSWWRPLLLLPVPLEIDLKHRDDAEMWRRMLASIPPPTIDWPSFSLFQSLELIHKSAPQDPRYTISDAYGLGALRETPRGLRAAHTRINPRCPSCQCKTSERTRVSTEVIGQDLNMVTCSARYCRDRAARGLL